MLANIHNLSIDVLMAKGCEGQTRKMQSRLGQRADEPKRAEAEGRSLFASRPFNMFSWP